MLQWQTNQEGRPKRVNRYVVTSAIKKDVWQTHVPNLREARVVAPVKLEQLSWILR